MEFKRKMAAILFSDVKGYSKLTEIQIKTFAETVIPEIAKPLKVVLNGKYPMQKMKDKNRNLPPNVLRRPFQNIFHQHHWIFAVPEVNDKAKYKIFVFALRFLL